MRYLSLEELLILHEYQIEKFGGVHGIRDIRLVESAVYRPQNTFDGKELYKDIFEKAGALGHAIITFHPFTDGNKRTGLYAMLVFLQLNGIEVSISNKELVNLGLAIAKGDLTIEPLSSFLRKHCV